MWKHLLDVSHNGDVAQGLTLSEIRGYEVSEKLLCNMDLAKIHVIVNLMQPTT